MTDSAKIKLPPHDRSASTLTLADDRIVLSEWLPPQQGVVPPDPHRSPMDQHSVGIADRSRITRSRGRLCPELAGASRCPGLHQTISWDRAVRTLGRFRLSVVVATAALPEHALHDVHHPRPGSRSWPIIRGSIGLGTARPERSGSASSTRFQKGRIWTSKDDSVTIPGWLGIPGVRHSIGLARWWHFSVLLLWTINGIAFYVLLFATGQWLRLVPVTWEVFPSALSTAIQYASLNFPVESSWTHYNGLQQLSYFITVFIAGAGFDRDRPHAESGDLQQARPARDRAEPAGRPAPSTSSPSPGSCCSSWRTASWCSSPACGRTRTICSPECRATRGPGSHPSSSPWRSWGLGLVGRLTVHDSARPGRAAHRTVHDRLDQGAVRMVGTERPTDREGHLAAFLAERHDAELRRVRRSRGGTVRPFPPPCRRTGGNAPGILLLRPEGSS